MNKEMLNDRVDYGKLEPQYHFSHLLCLKFHDHILSDLLSEKFDEKSTYSFSVESMEPPENDENTLDWLRTHGHEQGVDEFLSYHLVRGLLSDFCQFVLASLRSVANMQISVGYTLLRKPFLEVLLMLEQLLCDEEEFMKSFSRSSKEYNPTSVRGERKRELIAMSISHLSRKDMYDAGRIFDLRYNNKCEDSLYCMTNLATHIVTTKHQLITTERQNLNLVFLRDEDFDSHLEYIYFFIPYLLHYAVEMVETLLTRKGILEESEFKYRQLLRFLGFTFFTEQSSRVDLTHETPIDILSGELKLTCEYCNKSNPIFKSDFMSFYLEEMFECKYCLMPLAFDEETLQLLYEIFHI
jgi:hypothetical protein